MATDFLIDGQIKGGNTNSSGSTGVTFALNRTTILNEAGAKTYVLPAPVAGATMRIVKNSTSTATQTVNSTLNGTAVSIGATANNLVFTVEGQAVDLLGISATKWQIVNNTGSVTTS